MQAPRDEATTELCTHWGADSQREAYLEAATRDAIRHFTLGIGHTTWCKGRVVDKRRRSDIIDAEGEVWTENQRQEITAQGRALVVLPAKVTPDVTR